MMTVAGILLVLMILGKAVGMADRNPDIRISGDGRSLAAQCLISIWKYSYPAGKASEQIKGLKGSSGLTAGSRVTEAASGSDEMPGWLSFLWNQNPVVRFLSIEQSMKQEYSEEDPAYETYLNNQMFYEEHQYLKLYGDEESNQQMAAHDDVPPVEPADGAEIPQREGVQTVMTGTSGRQLPVVGTQYVMAQLADYDFLMKHFYSVHTSTTATREEMNASVLLGKDLSIKKDPNVPQILIYHTHSQETFADYGPENPEATVVGMGSYLTELLEAKGYNVIHHKGVYDLVNGELDRSKAYTYALDGITSILQENPSIEVVLDLHRDGVKEGLHLVNEVNGKQTAPIMFFNGMSQTPTGAIEYLQNPYKEDNLAFSLQMQVDAAAYFPGLTRKIYLKGLRYNLHVRPRSSLVEVGAQTNTYEEARNAMEPLAELLDMVLQGN